jgi:peptidoglycan/LPS O-acetylase OafA/YrhL
MVLLGGASYSVYLLRLPVTTWARIFLSGLPAGFVRFGELLAPLILVAFSIPLFRYWEEPPRKAVRRWFAKNKARMVSLPTSASATPVGD